MADLNFMQKNPSENEHDQLYREMGFTAVKVVIWKSKLYKVYKHTEKRINAFWLEMACKYRLLREFVLHHVWELNKSSWA